MQFGASREGKTMKIQQKIKRAAIATCRAAKRAAKTKTGRVTTKAAKATGRWCWKNKWDILFTIGGAALGGAAGRYGGKIVAKSAATALGKTGWLGKTATTGYKIAKLNGAAGTKASLAAIGKGALKVGGNGIRGGITTIAKVGGRLGGGVGTAAGRWMRNEACN
jgi:hypothetical protein